jgi:hypothetical protein
MLNASNLDRTSRDTQPSQLNCDWSVVINRLRSDHFRMALSSVFCDDSINPFMWAQAILSKGNTNVESRDLFFITWSHLSKTAPRSGETCDSSFPFFGQTHFKLGFHYPIRNPCCQNGGYSAPADATRISPKENSMRRMQTTKGLTDSVRSFAATNSM